MSRRQTTRMIATLAGVALMGGMFSVTVLAQRAFEQKDYAEAVKRFRLALDREILREMGAKWDESVQYVKDCLSFVSDLGGDILTVVPSTVGKVTPIDEIGTDRHRLDSYTLDLAVNQSTLYVGYDAASGRLFFQTRPTEASLPGILPGIHS